MQYYHYSPYCKFILLFWDFYFWKMKKRGNDFWVTIKCSAHSVYMYMFRLKLKEIYKFKSFRNGNIYQWYVAIYYLLFVSKHFYAYFSPCNVRNLFPISLRKYSGANASIWLRVRKPEYFFLNVIVYAIKMSTFLSSVS